MNILQYCCWVFFSFLPSKVKEEADIDQLSDQNDRQSRVIERQISVPRIRSQSPYPLGHDSLTLSTAVCMYCSHSCFGEDGNVPSGSARYQTDDTRASPPRHAPHRVSRSRVLQIVLLCASESALAQQQHQSRQQAQQWHATVPPTCLRPQPTSYPSIPLLCAVLKEEWTFQIQASINKQIVNIVPSHICILFFYRFCFASSTLLSSCPSFYPCLGS